MNVEIADLGNWGARRLLSEYDPRAAVIRINIRCVNIVRQRRGERTAQAFITCAIAHELFHALNPEASEAEAHAYAQATCGVTPQFFEEILRT